MITINVVDGGHRSSRRAGYGWAGDKDPGARWGRVRVGLAFNDPLRASIRLLQDPHMGRITTATHQLFCSIFANGFRTPGRRI